MSDDIDNDDVAVLEDELEVLKQRATTLGITFHPSIGLEKLREKVNGKLAEKEPLPVGNMVYGQDTTTVGVSAGYVETENEKRIRLKRESNQLIRIRITCMNPHKKEYTGEIFTTGNALVGTIRQFVPFNNEEGWHVRMMIYQMIKERQCQIFTSTKDARGNTVRKGKIIKEFAIDVMPELTMVELQELAQRQAMSKSID